MGPNNLMIALFIVNCIDWRSAEYIGQTLVPYNETSKHSVLSKVEETKKNNTAAF